MDTSLKIVIVGSILFILMEIFSKKKITMELKISLISIPACFLMAGLFAAVADALTLHLSYKMISLLKFASHVSFRMALGIILTLWIFGQFKFIKKS